MLYLEISILPHCPLDHFTWNDARNLPSSLQWRILQQIKWMETVSTTTRPNWYHNLWDAADGRCRTITGDIVGTKEFTKGRVIYDARMEVGVSWILATVSYSLTGFDGVVVGVLGKFSPDEYSLIPNL